MDETTLKIAVDSTQVNDANKALDEFAAKGAKAEASATRLENANKTAAVSFGNTAAQVRKNVMSFKGLEDLKLAFPNLTEAQLAKVAAQLGVVERQATATAQAVASVIGSSGTPVALKTKGPPVIPTVPLPGVVNPQIDPKAAQFLASLQQMAANAGKSKLELLGMQAAELGVATQARGLIAQIAEASKHTHTFSLENAQAKRELLVLAHELAQGNYKRFGTSMMVLGEYTGAAGLIMSKTGLAIGGVVAVLGLLALAAYKAADAQEKLRNASILSGNYAGITPIGFEKQAQDISQSLQVPIGQVKDFTMALVQSGEVPAEVMQRAGRVAVEYGKLTGKSAEEATKFIAKIAEDPKKALLDINRTIHEFSAADYELVRNMQDTGRESDAANFILGRLDQRFSVISQSTGYWNARIKELRIALSDLWNTIEQGIGGPADLDAKISAVQAKLAGMANIKPGQNQFADLQKQQLTDQLTSLNKEKFQQSERATQAAIEARQKTESAQARAWIDEAAKKAKAGSALKEALDNARAQFDKAATGPGAVPVPKATQDLILANIRKSFQGHGQHEADQVRRAQLAQTLEEDKAALKEEQDAIAYAQHYIEAAYKQGNLSIVEYYDEKRRLIAAGVDAEIAELEKEKAAIQDALNPKSKTYETDPSTRVTLQTRLNKITQQETQIRAKASADTVLANQAEAESFIELARKVDDYRAQILQAAGDEAGAARIRTARTLDQARIVANQSGQAFDFNALQRELQTRDQINEVKRQSSLINSALQVEEESIARLVDNGTITELQSYNLLAQARADAIPQVKALVDALEELSAKFPKDLQLKIDTAKARLELQKLQDQLDPLAKKFNDAFKEQTGNFLVDLMTGKAKPLDALRTLANGINETISREVANNFTGQLFGPEGKLGGVGSFISKKLFGTKVPTPGEAPKIDLAGTTGNVQTSLANMQNLGLDPSTSALQRFSAAVDGATGSVQSKFAAPGVPGTEAPTPLTTGDFARFDRGQTLLPLQSATVQTQPVANVVAGADAMADASKAAASADIRAAQGALGLAQAAVQGGNALSLLPQIIATLQSAGIGGTGGPGGFIGNILGGLGLGGSASAFAPGGVASSGFGSGAAFGNMDLGLFFAEGGYTGDKPTKQAAGVVHGKEFVFSAPAVQAIGKDKLAAVHERAKKGEVSNLLGYMAGGYVSNKQPPGRLYGGPVTSGSLYEINEKGMPEVLAAGGRQYLMMGNKDGNVKNLPPAGRGDTILHVNVGMPPGASRQTAMQWGAEVGRHITHSLRRQGK